MNAPAVDPKLLYSLGLYFHSAATAVDRYFGQGTADSNPFLVVTVAHQIEVREMHREQRKQVESLMTLLNAIRQEARERRNEAREGLVMLCNTLRELNAGEAIEAVRKSIDELTVEVSAVAVAINSASL